MSSCACVDKIADSRSSDQSSSSESQLKFPGCTHFRRRNDNHYRCQQCRLNEGLALCTEDSPCEICKDWLPPAVLQGLPLAAKETEVTLFTDVSSSGWGAQLGSCSTQGQWSASQQLWHINALDMQAVINAVRDFLPHLRFRVVRLMCDNAVTVAYIENEGGTRSHALIQLTIQLLK